MQPRALGMTVNHRELEHILQSMADVLRNAAYAECNERYPVGHLKRAEYFDEVGTLLVMDETSIKALLKDAVEHYLQFHAVARNSAGNDFTYYLGDSFSIVANRINSQPQVLSFLSANFAHMCGQLAGMLSPVVEDLSLTGHGVDRVESFVLNTDESYYLVVGEVQETYDPKEDDLSTADVYQSPEVLQGIAERTHLRELNNHVNEIIANGTLNDLKYADLDREIKPIPFTPYIDPTKFMTIDTSTVAELGNF